MVLVVHPFGNTFVRALISALHAESELATFFTSVAFQADAAMLKAAPAKVRRQLGRRTFPVPKDLVQARPMGELIRHAFPAGAKSPDAPYAVGRNVDRAAARWLARRREERSVTGVYGYEDFALATFRVAEKEGLSRFYDLPIAYWRLTNRLLEEEAERYPAWAETMRYRLAPAHYDRKDEELELADAVFVPSNFVARSLQDFLPATKPVHVIPFGSPNVPTESPAGTRPSGTPLRVLFAGSMSQRKGLADVFEAMKLLDRKDVELRVLGSPLARLSFYHAQADFTHLPPRPHNEVLAAMRECDVFVLPSIVEGRALVQQEALACGLPIIVTANAGGEDLVDEGRTGFLVPIRNPAAIADRINWFSEHRDELAAMRCAAIAKAQEYPWEAYGQAIVKVILKRSVR